MHDVAQYSSFEAENYKPSDTTIQIRKYHILLRTQQGIATHILQPRSGGHGWVAHTISPLGVDGRSGLWGKDSYCH